MGALFSKLLILLLLATGGGYLALFHSKMPFKVLEERLTQNGLDADGISGAVNSRIHIDRIQVGRADGAHCVLEDVTLQYSGLRDLFFKHELRISELTVGQLLIKVPDEPKSTEDAGFSVARSERPTSLYPVAYYRAAQGVRLALIAQTTVTRIKFEMSSLAEPLRIDSVTLTDLRSERDELTINGLVARSEAMDLDYAGSKISGVVKSGLFPKLKSPLAFNGQLGSIGGKLTVDIAALGGKLAIHTNPDESATFQIKDFDLDEILNGGPPLKQLQLTLSVDNVNRLTPATLRVQPGEFLLGASKFAIPPDDLVHNHNSSAYVEGNTKVGALDVKARLALVPKMPGYFAIKLIPGQTLPDKEVLAGLFFGRNFMKLSEPQKQTVSASLPQFIF